MSRRSVPVGALVAWVVVVLGAAIAAWSLPIDDFWLTLASGRELVDGASPTEPLPFSWTDERDGSINPQWGAQLVLGASGSLGLALAINAALIATGLLITGVRSTARATAVPAAVAVLVALPALAPHLLARAQSFSIALFPLALLLLERYGARRWLPVAYGALMLVWANLHGAFVIGQFAAVAWLLQSLLQRRSRAIAGLTVFAAMLVPFANPAGAELVRYAYAQPATDVVRFISVEWQPAWPWIAIATPFWLLLVLVLVGRIRRRGGSPPAEMILVAGLAFLAGGGIRHIPWFVLAAVPMLADDAAAIVARSPRLGAALAWTSTTSRKLTTVVPIMVLAVVAFQFVRPELPRGIARLTTDAPVELAQALEQEATAGDRVLNEQVWGGYLAYRFGPDIQTAMDGRLEIRARDVWQDYFDLMHGSGQPASVLEARGVEWAMLMPDRHELISKLREARWTSVETSDEGVLLRSPDR